jgi:hypothetical protein
MVALTELLVVKEEFQILQVRPLCTQPEAVAVLVTAELVALALQV